MSDDRLAAEALAAANPVPDLRDLDASGREERLFARIVRLDRHAARPPASGVVTVTASGGIATMTIDDGGLNTLSLDVVGDLLDSLDAIEADGDARAVVIAGRTGAFSAGLDLQTIRGGGRRAAELFVAGGVLLWRVHAFPRPVVAACTGHAVAMGALLLLAADARIGVAGDFRVGLTELSAFHAMPPWMLRLGERVTEQDRQHAVTEGRTYDPSEAAAAGFLDAVVGAGEIAAAARDVAEQLAGDDPKTFADRPPRRAVLDEMAAGLRDDWQRLVRQRRRPGGSPGRS